MRRRRRRFFRDDVLAPWLTIGVILGFWWLGASVIRPDVVTPSAASSTLPNVAAARRETST